MSKSLDYRAEVDGLRAIAVLAVIVFHLDSRWLPGGFLGVDVFFVISGFLITAIILREQQLDRFSLTRFWIRRIKRLYPALLVMVSVVSLAGSLILINPERANLVAQSIAAVFSFENILLWQTTQGYWATTSENIPLLHTWSLSLEEQFYICFPTLLVVLHRYARNQRSLLILSLAICSFALCIYGTAQNRNAAFYLLPTRMWELLAGSCLALFGPAQTTFSTKRYFRQLSSLIGLGLILFSFFTIQNDGGFPGYKALLPCLGSVMVIEFGRRAGIVNYLLTRGPVTYIGKISYSLYLWHWPVIVFATYASPDARIGLVMTLTFGLAILSYHFIERPFRYGFKGSSKILISMPIASAACTIPLILWPTSPLIPKEFDQLNAPESLTRGSEFEGTELLQQGQSGLWIGSETKSPDLCLTGSSHARVLGRPFASFATKNDLSAVIIATSGVGITSRLRDDAESINEKRFAKLRELSPVLTIVAGMWSLESQDERFAATLAERLKLLSGFSDEVLVVSQVPMVELPHRYKGAMRKFILASSMSSENPALKPASEVIEANRLTESVIKSLRAGNVRFLDAYHLFIAANGTVDICKKGAFLYSDYHHLNDQGAEYLFQVAVEPLLSHRKWASIPGDNALKSNRWLKQ